MNVNRLLKLDGTITPTTAGTEDVFGDDPGAAGEPIAVKCWLSQFTRAELTANADTQSETWHLYLDAAVNGSVSGSDRIAIDGVTYELDGPPWPATNPRTKTVTHLEATVRKVA